MALRIKGNPYLAGTGTRPPYLAGRETEKSEIDYALDLIMGKTDAHGRLEGASPPLVLIGPRGVGKTVLLGWSKRRADELGIHCAVLSETLLGGPADDLGVAILGEKEYDKAAKERTTTRNYGHPLLSLIGIVGQTTHPTAVMSLRSLFNRKLSKKPLLVILDEAHAVAPGLLKGFFIAVQEFIDECRPLALVLAGTPGLRGVLRGISATFMERSRFLSLNLLTKDEAREALSVPAADTGVPMDEDALETLVEWTDCYPFFIQLAGETAWDVAKGRGASRITMEDVKQALNLAGKKRQDFYDGRFLELVDGKLDKYALQMIDLIEKQPEGSIGYKRSIVGIQEANEGMEYDRALEIQRSLMNLGFMHLKNERVEAGIPSLFDHVKKRAKD